MGLKIKLPLRSLNEAKIKELQEKYPEAEISVELHHDRIAYAKEIGEDSWQADQYFSVDNFLYARSCVVANGETLYQKVLNDPLQMPKDTTFESLLYIPSLAYKRRTGNTYDYIPAFPIETYSNQNAWLLTNLNTI